MKVSLEQAKNGETTATCNNVYLHSSYNPSKEAERFVASFNIKYTPPFIVITEPGLCYAIPLLKKRFPTSKIVIIRYCEAFNKYNNYGDYVIEYYNQNINFENSISNIITEDKLLNTLFLQWPPASKIFKELDTQLLSDIKKLFQNAKTLLVTREYFEKKWLLNSIIFSKYIANTITLTKNIDLPILIISSGPSLKDGIQTIKEHQNNYFIICLSSAIKVLLYNKIIPDLVMTTDGGYWAGQHLKSLYKYNIPVAIPSEGYIQKSLISKLNVLPMDYGDGLSSNVLNKCGINCIKASRNGTISGTALIFALTYSSSNIYYFGLDMSNQKGFQHCQPNENEINNLIKDNKLNNNLTRTTIAEFSKGVLDTYKDWFISLDLHDRKVYRVINTKYKNNTLGQIKDITVDDFKNLNTSNINKNNFFKIKKCNSNINNLKLFIKEIYKTEYWNKSLYPLSYSSLFHNHNNSEIIERLEKENSIIFQKIWKYLND